MIWSRRQFLNTGAATALGLGLNVTSPAFLQRQILAGDPDGDTKLVVIFQRGGNDGINTVVPHGDTAYNTTNRPTLYLPENTTFDLGNGFAGLHPSMGPMMTVFNSTDLTGVEGPGNLACIHRVGYSGQSRSHFDSQKYWENAWPGEANYDEGMLYRLVQRQMNPLENPLASITISGSQVDALKGRFSLPALRDPENFRFDGDPNKVAKFLGSKPTTSGGTDGSGLLGLYDGPRDFVGKRYRDMVYGTGRALADSIEMVQSAVAQGPYVPENGAAYGNNSFGEKMEYIAMLLKRTPARVLFANIGGWDTHTNQANNHGNLLYRVACGFQELYLDLQDQWENLIIVTMTEFGRTSKENGSMGTDHANACVMFVGGGRVNGGVYNCDSETWADGDIFSRRGRYLERRTDYRQIFAQIFTELFGNTQDDNEFVIPTLAAARQHAADEALTDFDPLPLFG